MIIFNTYNDNFERGKTDGEGFLLLVKILSPRSDEIRKGVLSAKVSQPLFNRLYQH